MHLPFSCIPYLSVMYHSLTPNRGNNIFCSDWGCATLFRGFLAYVKLRACIFTFSVYFGFIRFRLHVFYFIAHKSFWIWLKIFSTYSWALLTSAYFSAESCHNRKQLGIITEECHGFNNTFIGRFFLPHTTVRPLGAAWAKLPPCGGQQKTAVLSSRWFPSCWRTVATQPWACRRKPRQRRQRGARHLHEWTQLSTELRKQTRAVSSSKSRDNWQTFFDFPDPILCFRYRTPHFFEVVVVPAPGRCAEDAAPQRRAGEHGSRLGRRPAERGGDPASIVGRLFGYTWHSCDPGYGPSTRRVRRARAAMMMLMMYMVVDVWSPTRCWWWWWWWWCWWTQGRIRQWSFCWTGCVVAPQREYHCHWPKWCENFIGSCAAGAQGST